MGIGSITSANSMSGIKMIPASMADTKSKKIQNEITNTQQQMQKISSKEELSANEKATERKKLQKEISSLNTELKQHQEKLSKSQKRELMLGELQEDHEPAKEEKADDQIQAKETSSVQANEKNLPADQQQTGQQGTIIANNSDGIVILKEKVNQNEKQDIDTESEQAVEVNEENTTEKEAKTIDSDAVTDSSLSHKKMHAIVSADASVEQANRQGAIIARTRDGIAILKSEINQDEKFGINTEKKQAELEKMEEKEQRAVTFQFSVLGEANNTMKSAANTNAARINGTTQIRPENNAFFNALKVLQEDWQTSQQNFNIAFS